MKKQGQSILEYVIILTTIIGVVVYAARNLIQPAVWKVFVSAGRVLSNAGERVSNTVRGQRSSFRLSDGMSPVDTWTLGVLARTTAGQYYVAFFKDNEIQVSYLDYGKYGMDPHVGAEWSSGYNAIIVNSNMVKEPEKGAAALAHEGVHADYSFNPDKWIADTLRRYPGLKESDLHIRQPPGNSIDQEYNAIKAQSAVWEEIKGGKFDENNDGWAAVMLQGEDDAKVFIRQAYSDADTPLLPEF